MNSTAQVCRDAWCVAKKYSSATARQVSWWLSAAPGQKTQEPHLVLRLPNSRLIHPSSDGLAPDEHSPQLIKRHR